MLKNIVKFKILLALSVMMIFAGTAKSITVTGTLSTTPPPAGPGYTTGAGTQTGRLNRGGATTTSTCAAPMTTTAFNTTPFVYHTYTFTPTTTQCVTVTVSPLVGSSIFVNAYNQNGFNPADIAANQLASAGVSTGTGTTTFSFNVTAGVPFTLDIIDVMVPAGGTTYSVNVDVMLGGGGPQPRPLSAVLDFDGDRITCYTVFRPSNNTWYIRSSVNGSVRIVQFGNAGTDILTPGDYDGDGKTDISVWRTTTATYFTLRSSDNTFAAFRYGISTDEPVNRDYDGDGRTDYAVVRRTSGRLFWYYAGTANGGNTVATQFGLATDIVAPGDYDGDRRFDLAVRRGTGNERATFFVQQSTAGFRAVQFGLGSDIVAPGDYDGDGKTDFTAVRQGSPYFWFILNSSTNTLTGVQWGDKPMFIAQGDYNGNGKTDITVWDPTSGKFFVHPIPGSPIEFKFGQNGDYPVANTDTH